MTKCCTNKKNKKFNTKVYIAGSCDMLRGHSKHKSTFCYKTEVLNWKRNAKILKINPQKAWHIYFFCAKKNPEIMKRKHRVLFWIDFQICVGIKYIMYILKEMSVLCSIITPYHNRYEMLK